MFEYVVHVVAPHIEQVEVLAGGGREGFLPGVGLEVEQAEGLKALGRLAEGVAGTLECGRNVISPGGLE